MNDIEDGFITPTVRGKDDHSSSHFNVKVRSKLTGNSRRVEKNDVESDSTTTVTTNGYASKCNGSPFKESSDDARSDCCDSGNCCQIESGSICNPKKDPSEAMGETIEVNSKLEKLHSDHDEMSGGGSALPWRYSVYVRTWGCSHNNSDSEYMSGLLAAAGYRLIDRADDADLWLLNSCTVKTPSETQLSNQVADAQRHGKRVVVAGCVSQASPSEAWLKDVSIVGVQQIDRVVEVVSETLNGNVVRLLSTRQLVNKSAIGKQPATLPLDLPKVRRNALVEILAINSGCLNHCTYCKTKQARGDLRSFPLDALTVRARHALMDDGCRELWLTSEDLGAWGRDVGMVIPDLLQALVDVIPDGCMMRLGMTNPPYILDHLSEIAAILRHPRVYSFLHIPVQSGSDAVLNEMRREYTRDQFCQIVDYMLENVPDVYIATDFICAFPTETEEDFEESMTLVQRYRFPSLFINQYYPRPATPAARLKKIETSEARRRTAAMSRLFRSYSRYTAQRIGTAERVLVCEMATDGRHFVGHNKSYEHILIEPSDICDLMGKWLTVLITEVSKFYMKARLVSVLDETQTLASAQMKKEVNESNAANNDNAESSNKTVLTPAPAEKSSKGNNGTNNGGLLLKIVIISQLCFILYLIVKTIIIRMASS